MSTSSRTPWLAALFFAALLNGLLLHFWTTKDTRPCAWDQALHTNNAFEFRERIRHGSVSDWVRPTYFDYPPLYYVQLAPLLSRVSDVADAGAVVNYFYMCLIGICLFFIGERLFGRWEGLTAAVLFSCYPFVNSIESQTVIDLSLTGWVTLGFLCLLMSDHFERPGWSAGFGAAIGFGMLTKWTAPVYLAAPALMSLAIAGRRKKWGSILLAGVVAGVILFPWYVVNFLPSITRVHALADLTPATGESRGFVNLMWYPLGLIEQLNVPFLLLLLPGLCVVFWRPKALLPLLWFAAPLVLFSLIHNRNLRYSLPALPAAALLSAAWLPPVRRVSYVLVQALAVGFVATIYLVPQIRVIKTIGSQTAPVIVGLPAYADDWKHAAVIEKIRRLKIPGKKMARVVVVSNHPHFHGATLNVTLRAENVDDVVFSGVGKRRWFEFADFVLLQTGDIRTEQGGNIQQCADTLKAPPAWFGRVFKEVGRWALPENSEAILYQCQPAPANVHDAGLFNLSLRELALPNINATGVRINAVPLSPSDSRVGRFKELRIRCEHLEYKKLRFDQVDVRLLRPQINLELFLATQEIQLNSLETLEPHARIAVDTLLAYAAQKAKWLKNPSIRFDGARVFVSGTAGIAPVEIEAELKIEDQRFKSRLIKMTIAHIPFPRILVRAFSDQNIDLRVNEDLAYNLDLAQIQGLDGALRIGL